MPCWAVRVGGTTCCDTDPILTNDTMEIPDTQEIDMTPKPFLTLAAAAALAACAQSPGSIPPAAMPDGSYAHLTCGEAAQEHKVVTDQLSALEGKQRGAVAGDAIGVLLIGVPVSSLVGGDQEGNIAVAKGRVLALEARLGGCRRAAAPVAGRQS